MCTQSKTNSDCVHSNKKQDHIIIIKPMGANTKPVVDRLSRGRKIHSRRPPGFDKDWTIAMQEMTKGSNFW